MNFSIILNTRGRVELLNNLLKSIHAKTQDISKVEILIWCDYDDLETIQYSTSDAFLQFNNENIKICIGHRNKNLSVPTNYLAKLARGKYVFILNDDVEILTEHWDEIVLSSIRNFKISHSINDDIIYGYTHDTSVDKVADKQYSSFFIISKQAIDVVGFLIYSNFYGLGGDSSIYRLYNSINRVVDVGIALDHIYHNSIDKVMNPDLTAREMRNNSSLNYVDPFTINIENESMLLQKFIKNYEKIPSDVR